MHGWVGSGASMGVEKQVGNVWGVQWWGRFQLIWQNQKLGQGGQEKSNNPLTAPQLTDMTI